MTTAITKSVVWTKNVSQKRIVKKTIATKTTIATMKNAARMVDAILRKIVTRNARMILIALMRIVAQNMVDVTHLIRVIGLKIV